MTKLDRQQMQMFPCICCLSSLVTMQLLGIAFILYIITTIEKFPTIIITIIAINLLSSCNLYSNVCNFSIALFNYISLWINTDLGWEHFIDFRSVLCVIEVISAPSCVHTIPEDDTFECFSKEQQTTLVIKALSVLEQTSSKYLFQDQSSLQAFKLRGYIRIFNIFLSSFIAHRTVYPVGWSNVM